MAPGLPPTRTPLIDLSAVVEQLRRIADAMQARPAPASPPPSADGSAAPVLAPAEQATLDALRKWRSETARKEGLPAYIVAYNATLREVAERKPRTLDELASVRGFGPAKLARYGPAVLEVVSH